MTASENRNGTSDPAPANGPGDAFDVGAFLGQGEYVTIGEHLIVARVWGRFRRGPVSQGADLKKGSVVGYVESDGADSSPVVSPEDGTFLDWLAVDGEHASPGFPVARFSQNGDGPAGDPPSRNGARNGKR